MPCTYFGHVMSFLRSLVKRIHAKIPVYVCVCVCVYVLDCMFILFHSSLSSSCWNSFCFVVAGVVGRTEDRYICWYLITLLFEELDLLDKQ